MRVAISGATGFIGQRLATYLTGARHQVVPLARRLLLEESFGQLVETLEQCDVLINLAGASINHRWTEAHKENLRNSRIGVTSQLVCALKAARRKPRLMISISAVGYYPSTGRYVETDEVVGDGFLASLCRDWEAEARLCPQETRLVIARLGIVFSPDGGALWQMIKPVMRTKVSVVFGSGQQPLAWIGLQDVCRALLYFIEHEEEQGVYNLVSPQKITQKHLASVLFRAYRAWLMLPMPAWLLRSLLGEMSSVLLKGQQVVPFRLLQSGFRFAVPTVERFFGLPDVAVRPSLPTAR